MSKTLWSLSPAKAIAQTTSIRPYHDSEFSNIRSLFAEDLHGLLIREETVASTTSFVDVHRRQDKLVVMVDDLALIIL